ncbi:hypothetical protein BDZ89DRAFT_1046065 [Hymenopellis radicata]|nr:hypothetical protein BDZ89DRAFT_1046065 [Hymenopellis radicata]
MSWMILKSPPISKSSSKALIENYMRLLTHIALVLGIGGIKSISEGRYRNDYGSLQGILPLRWLECRAWVSCTTWLSCPVVVLVHARSLRSSVLGRRGQSSNARSSNAPGRCACLCLVIALFRARSSHARSSESNARLSNARSSCSVVEPGRWALVVLVHVRDGVGVVVVGESVQLGNVYGLWWKEEETVRSGPRPINKPTRDADVAFDGRRTGGKNGLERISLEFQRKNLAEVWDVPVMRGWVELPVSDGLGEPMVKEYNRGGATASCLVVVVVEGNKKRTSISAILGGGIELGMAPAGERGPAAPSDLAGCDARDK